MATEAAATAAPKAGAIADTKAPAADPKAAGVAKPVEQVTRDIIVNGKPVKVTDKQLVALAQKGMFADSKLKSLDVLQKSAASLIEKLKSPEGLLEILKDPKLGASPKEVFRKLMASDVIDDELKEDMTKWVYDKVVVAGKKTPEQLETEKKLSEYEKMKKQQEDQRLKQLSEQQKAQVQQIYQAVRSEVVKQVAADKTFPQVEGSIRAVVEKLRVMNKQGTQITPQAVTKAIELTKKDILLHQQAIFDAIEDPEALISFFGEARALKISKALVARLKTKAGAKETAKPAGEKKESLQEREKRHGTVAGGYQVMDVFGSK